VIESGGRRERALDHLRSKYEQYVREPPPGPVIAIDITAWRALALAKAPRLAN